MAQTFTGTQYARIGSKGMTSGTVGALSIIVIMKRAADSAGDSKYIFSHTDSANAFKAAMYFDGSNFLSYQTGVGSSGLNLSVTAAEGWLALGATKPAGSVTPVRFHKYSYTTNVSTHINGNAGVADFTGGGSTGHYLFTRFSNTVSTNNALGTYAIAAVYPRDLTDSEFHVTSLSLMSMMSYNPTYGLVLLDQNTAVLTDIFGGGTSDVDTGTIDAGGSVFPYVHPVMLG